MKVKVLLIPFLILCFVSSCITPRDTNLLQNIEKNYPIEVNEADYKIIQGDQLQLSVYTLDSDMKKLFGIYVRTSNGGDGEGGILSNSGGGQEGNILNVYSDGSVRIPYVGKIYVKGLTILEAKRLIREKISTFSLSKTQEPVTVDVVLANRYFSVLGEAGASKIAMRAPRMTIYQALATAGQINKTGDLKSVKIIRQTEDGTEVKTFDLRTKDIVDSEFYYVQANDVIYVQQLKRRFFGEVTSFAGVFGIITTTIATIVGVIGIADAFK